MPPALVALLAGNSVTAAAIFACLNPADASALRRLHPAVATAVESVRWADTAMPVVDAVRWRAALPGAVGGRLTWTAVRGVLTSSAAAPALDGVTCLDLRACADVTDELLARLPPSLRSLNVRHCNRLSLGASFVHLTALAVLDCGGTEVLGDGVDGLPLSLRELDIGEVYGLQDGVSLAHLTHLQVLRAATSPLNDATLESLPPSLTELHVASCGQLTAAASFAHLPALRVLDVSACAIDDAVLASLPPSLVALNVAKCGELTEYAVLPHLPALRLLDVCGTNVGDALLASLPASLGELRLVRCPRVTAGATLDAVPALRALYSSDTDLAPDVLAGCRARGCAVPAAGELRGHGNQVMALAVAAGDRLVSGAAGAVGEMRVWDVAPAAGGEATAVVSSRGPVAAMAALPDGDSLAVSRVGGGIEVGYERRPAGARRDRQV